MATQAGTGSLVLGDPSTRAALYIPMGVSGDFENAIIESCNEIPGGEVSDEDVYDHDGAFHTNITYEAGMDGATIVAVGKTTTLSKNDMTGPTGGTQNYQVRDIQREGSKGPVRYTITVRKLPTVT